MLTGESAMDLHGSREARRRGMPKHAEESLVTHYIDSFHNGSFSLRIFECLCSGRPHGHPFSDVLPIGSCNIQASLSPSLGNPSHPLLPWLILLLNVFWPIGLPPLAALTSQRHSDSSGASCYTAFPPSIPIFEDFELIRQCGQLQGKEIRSLHRASFLGGRSYHTGSMDASG